MIQHTSNDVGDLTNEFKVVVKETEQSQKMLFGSGIKKVGTITG